MGCGDDPVIAEQSSSADMDAILPQGNAVWLGSHIRRQPAGLACTQGHDDQEDGKEEELSLWLNPTHDFLDLNWKVLLPAGGPL